jgi:O-acetyl-ADP-ribose deacetylase (regulator of RNase III)
LDEYSSLIELFKFFHAPNSAPKEKIKRNKLVVEMLKHLISELPKNHRLNQFDEEKSSYKENRDKLYTLLTIRNPKPLPSWFNLNLDSLLKLETLEVGITNSHDLLRVSQSFPKSSYRAKNQIILWQGDITTLQVDAIVNAANKSLLGCFRPFHHCIDNAIHSVAGPRLRDDCNTIIKHQGCPEETGWAKITRAYNLPSKFVLHTVGPIFDKRMKTVSPKQENELSNCYVSCLNLAKQIPTLKNIAFCSISTGIFGFPIAHAAKIALKIVDKWLKDNPNIFDYIVFNVFSQHDYQIYKILLEGG